VHGETILTLFVSASSYNGLSLERVLGNDIQILGSCSESNRHVVLGTLAIEAVRLKGILTACLIQNTIARSHE
jgi:hypothetical protein